MSQNVASSMALPSFEFSLNWGGGVSTLSLTQTDKLETDVQQGEVIERKKSDTMFLSKG